MVQQYPLIVAANRDEHYDRPSAAPNLWSTEPEIMAGKDLLAGGTWLGVNERGVLAGILNRRFPNDQSKPVHARSRGLFCLDLLHRSSAAEARQLTQRQDESYQPFTVLCADADEAWMAYNTDREVRTQRLADGLHVLSNTADFNIRSAKIDRAYARFAEVASDSMQSSQSATEMVCSLRNVLADHALGSGSQDPREAICVHGDTSGTVSSTIIFYSQPERRFYVFDCPGPPCLGSFGEALALDLR